MLKLLVLLSIFAGMGPAAHASDPYLNVQIERCSGVMVDSRDLMSKFDASSYAKRNGVEGSSLPTIHYHQKSDSCDVAIPLKDRKSGKPHGQIVLQVLIANPDGTPWTPDTKGRPWIRLAPEPTA